MNQPSIGQILENEEVGRDAIHIAIAPVVAAERLAPGERVALEPDSADRVYGVGLSAKSVGIIDPYLTAPVRAGARCYVFLHPQTITSLRHEWTHPAFERQPRTAEGAAASRQWVEEFAARIHVSYGELMRAAEKYAEFGEWTTLFQNEAYKDVSWEPFWKHYAAITGKAVEETDAPFTCSC